MKRTAIAIASMVPALSLAADTPQLVEVKVAPGMHLF